jgi:recombination associated protein RdgC
VSGWLAIDAASHGRAEDVIRFLLKAVERFPLDTLRVAQSSVAAMTEWLLADEAPGGFTIDQDTELRAMGEGKATVRYVRHTLEVDDVRRHIEAGKQCKRLAMTWSEKISFVLTESLGIKRIAPLDVLKEGDTGASNDDERFDADLMLMTGELAKLLADLVEALGGEVTVQAKAA